MSEFSSIERVETPNTVRSLADDMRRLGLQEGMNIIVHSSLSSIGWVCGGAQAVIKALIDIVTAEGTIVMPAHTGHLSDPAGWGNPPVPEAWWAEIRESMPAFEAGWTPTYGMGTIAESFRTIPGATRSNHPQTSFAAWGVNADRITSGQSLHFGMGEQSPLARLYELGAYVLLLGVGYDSNTSFHLAEYRTAGSPRKINFAPVLVDGRREWKSFDELDFRTDKFDRIGEEFERTSTIVRSGRIGLAPAKLFPMRDSVDFAVLMLK